MHSRQTFKKSSGPQFQSLSGVLGEFLIFLGFLRITIEKIHVLYNI